LVNLLRRARADENNINPQKDEEKDGREEKNGFDLQRIVPFNGLLPKNIIGEKEPLHNGFFFKITNHKFQIPNKL